MCTFKCSIVDEIIHSLYFYKIFKNIARREKRMQYLLAALFCCSILEGMDKTKHYAVWDKHYKACTAAISKINEIIDVYLQENKSVEDIRLKEPLLEPWCKPTKEGLTLEVLSKLHLTKNSVRCSLRTPWGLMPLIEFKQREQNSLTRIFRDMQVTNSINATLLYQESNHRKNQHITIWEKEKCAIIKVANIDIPPLWEDNESNVILVVND